MPDKQSENQVQYCNYVSVLHRFCDIAYGWWIENRQLKPIVPLFGAMVMVIHWNFVNVFGVRKLESLGYHMTLIAQW